MRGSEKKRTAIKSDWTLWKKESTENWQREYKVEQPH
jgi:hypothetical protein